MKLVECIPNFSEGRDLSVVNEIRDCFQAGGARLLDFTADADHNRCVATVIGDPYAVAQCVCNAVGVATQRIDLRKHKGEHPAIGATDVIPFVPIKEMDEKETVRLSAQVSQTIASQYGIPVYLYEQSARRINCRNLADIRHGGFENLSNKMSNWDWIPDYGPIRPHLSAGATAVGARNFLIAYNVVLETDDLSIAKRIAKAIRERDGGLPAVKALGVYLDTKKSAQVTMNLVDYRKTGLQTVFEEVRTLALGMGVNIRDSEIIGMIPAAAAQGITTESIRLDSMLENKIIENRLPPEWLAERV